MLQPMFLANALAARCLDGRSQPNTIEGFPGNEASDEARQVEITAAEPVPSGSGKGQRRIGVGETRAIRRISVTKPTAAMIPTQARLDEPDAPRRRRR